MGVDSDQNKKNHKTQTRLEKLQTQKFMLFSLIGTGFAFLIVGSFGMESATIFTNWIFILISAFLVVLSCVSIKIHGTQGNHGKAWIIFTVFTACWFIAELLWTINELYYHKNPFPSEADAFYLAGYPAYFIFSIFYITPVKKAISKKMMLLASLISMTILIPNLYMTFDNNSGESQFAIALGAVYPIADAIVLVPAMLGVTLFFGGKVNFLWSLMLIGILLQVAADTGFQYFSLDDSIYTGHPIDMLFLWTYIVFSFGVYDHIKIFKKEKNDGRYFDQENMR